MGITYTSTSVSGYNTSAPPDDGSETSGNEITWATIKSKLTDPLKTALEAVNANLVSDFGQTGSGATKDAGTASTEVSTNQNLWDEGYRPKNFIINQKFDIWQRNTSFTPTDGDYTADRWVYNVNLDSGSLASNAVSRQTHTLGQTDVPGEPKYYCRTQGQITSGGNAKYIVFGQRIEGVNTLANETITVVFYAKAGSARNLGVDVRQSFGTGGSPSADVITTGGSKSLTTSWAKYTQTITVPNINGKTLGSNGDDYLEVCFVMEAGSTASYTQITGTADTIDIGYVVVKRGSAEGPVEDRTIEQELASCQRYYQRVPTHVQGVVLTSSTVTLTYAFPVQMRSAPTATLLDTSPTVGINGTTSPTTGSSSTISSQISSADGGYLRIDGFTGLTAKDHVRLAVANVADWSAEL